MHEASWQKGYLGREKVVVFGYCRTTEAAVIDVRAKWKTLLSDPTPWFWMLLAVVVGLPTLGMGLSGMIGFNALMQERWPPGTHWGPLFEFFHFIPGPSERRVMDYGVVSWWADRVHGAFSE